MAEGDDDGSSDRAGKSGGVLAAGLRERVEEAFKEFEHCFDAAVAQPTSTNLEALHEATDRLMRAGARVLIELGQR